MRRYVAGGSEPAFGNVVAIASFCGVTLEWLAYGHGPVTLDDEMRVVSTAYDETAFVPVFNIRAAAGAGAINHDHASGERFPASKSLLRKCAASADNVQAIRVVGDSMSPTIDDGALILVDRAQREIIEGGVYIVSLGEEVRIKRLHKTMSGRITLRSDGDKTFFPDEELDRQEAEQLVIHGRVFWAEKLL